MASLLASFWPLRRHPDIFFFYQNPVQPCYCRHIVIAAYVHFSFYSCDYTHFLSPHIRTNIASVLPFIMSTHTQYILSTTPRRTHKISFVRRKLPSMMHTQNAPVSQVATSSSLSRQYAENSIYDFPKPIYSTNLIFCYCTAACGSRARFSHVLVLHHKFFLCNRDLWIRHSRVFF